MTKKYEKLVDASNEVIRLSEKRRVTVPRMISALMKAIDGYEELIKSYDPEKVEPLSPEDAGYIDKDAFERKFVPQEQRILRDSKLKKNSRAVLIRQSRRIKKVKSSDIPRPGIPELESIKAELEQLKSDLEQAEKNDQERREGKRRIRRKWGRISKLVGGATLIALDTAAAGANPTLAPATAVSVAAGSLLMAERRTMD